ncbi:MAG: tRNA-specific adenosine deaminase [Desulfobulbus sp.]|nr:MAG: tRNA-specific adenosine deaminase [Desulfobulbus sp.]
MLDNDSISLPEDEIMMKVALEEARKSSAIGEVPVGAVITLSGRIIACRGNNVRADRDPSGHAEIRALRQAARKLGNYRLPGAVLYVTLEPCPMCAAAMVHARIARLVYGAVDPKGGGVVSKYGIGVDGLLNHRFSVTGGVLQEKCSKLLRDFFQKRR